MSQTIDVLIYREDDQWIAQALNVDIASFGATPEEARRDKGGARIVFSG